MAEHWAFLIRLRHDLGKSYTVAEERGADPSRVNLLVRRHRHDEMLVIVADARWLAVLMLENPVAARVEYKHLTVMVRNFFDQPETLPSHTFHWPGSAENREELRRVLSRRRRAQLR